MATIEPVPILPPGIKDALDRDQFVVFVGAGVSRLVGCIGWEDLGKNLVSACFDKKYINFKEKEKLSTEADHRKTISICYHIITERNKDPELFYQHLNDALQPKPERAKQFPVYEELYRLRAVFVTTNADDIFDKLFNRQAIIYRAQDFPNKSFDRTKLYHLHGTIHDRLSLVFSLDEYIRHYRKRQVHAFLQNLFKEYTILFVGYGLAELQLLEYLITGSEKDDGVVRHFYLLPMYKDEENLFEFEQAYFKKLGIQVIAYDIADNGYEQLYHVMKAWQTEINLTSRSLASTFEFIERVAADYDPATAEQVLQLIRNDPPVADHFFKHASDPKWLVPLKEAGYFDPTKNPEPIEVRDSPGMFTIPYWSPLRYLEKVATHIPPDDSGAFTAVTRIVREIVDYRDSDGKRIENFRTDWAVTNIYAAVPDRFMEPEDIDRVLLFLQSQWGRGSVDAEVGISLLPHLLRSRNKELTARLYAAMLSYQWETRAGSEEPVPLVEEFWLSEAMKKHLPAITDLIAIEAAQSTIRVMQEIVEREATAFHIFSIPSLESLGWPEFPDRYEGILVFAARDTIVATVAQLPEEGKAIVKHLLRQSHDIFRRLALYAVAEQWETLKDEFWAFASPDLLTDPFDAPELRAVIKNHFVNFTHEQKNTWVEWIEDAPYWIPDEIKEDREQTEKYLASEKLRQLSAIRGKGYRPADELYEKYTLVVGEEVAEAEESDISGSEPMPVISEAESVASRLLELSIAEVVQFLATQPQDQHLWESRETEVALQKAVETAPDKFIVSISAFQAVSADHQEALIRGFAEAWKSGKTFDWKPLLDFCKRLVNAEGFWAVPNLRLVKDVAELILVGTQTDARSFDPVLLPEAEAILLTMLIQTPSSVQGESNLVDATLNSPKGKVVLAAITYSLQVARLKKDEAVGRRWPSAIREEFTKRLDRRYDGSLEFSVSLGQYLIYLYRLDKDWIEQNIDLIFPKDNERHWLAAFTGYLAQGRVYNEFYDILRSRNHYEKGLTADIQPRRLRERLIHHICFAYLRNAESLDDPTSMIRKLIDGWDPETINDIIGFFWLQRKGSQPSDAFKALALWKLIAEHCEQKQELTTVEKVMLSHLAEMSVYLNSIDQESLGWLKLTAKYADQGHDTPVLVENLDRLADASPRNAGLVFLEMLNNDIYPAYDAQHIISAVEKVYLAGERELGNSICNMYLRRGHEFLRDLFNQYNE